LIVGFATSIVTCQYIDSSPPFFVYPVALQTDHVPLTSYAPGVGAPDHRFSLPPPFPPLFTRRPRTAYGSSIVHDTNDPASACGIDGLHKFPIFPPPTPTRTSLASFEPLLTLLTRPLCRSVLLFCGPPPLPRVCPGQFQEALAKWYSVGGSLDLSS